MMRVALICAVGSSFPAFGGEKLVSNDDTLVFMGDSITEFGLRRSHGYVNLVVKGLAANGISPKWEGVGIQGEKSGDMLKRFDRDVVAKKATVVTISAGVNDIHQKKSFESFMENERAMVAKTKAMGAKTVLLSPTTAGFGEPDTDELRRFVGGVKGLAREEGLAYAQTYEQFRDMLNDVDSPALTLLNNGGLKGTCDFVHMSSAGDRRMARATLRAFGLDEEEMAKAETAWNEDASLVPLVRRDGDSDTFSVSLTADEEKSVAGQSILEILSRGIPSLAADPKFEAEKPGASVVKTVDKSSGHVSYRDYDQLVIAARALGITVQDAIKCAILRGARGATAPKPGVPVVELNAVGCGATTATFDATIKSVGATAGACDVFLRYGTNAKSLGKSRRVVLGENGTFAYLLKGLEPNTGYAYELSFVNNASEPKKAVIRGTFKTLAKGDLLEPGGEDDTAAIQAALDAAAPAKGRVTLAGGVFKLSNELTVSNGVALVGQGAAKTTLVQGGSHRVATLKGGARLEGVTVTGGKTPGSWQNGGGVFVEDGTVSKCRVWHNLAGIYGNNTHGGGVFLVKGSIDHSVVAFNRTGSTGAGGGICTRSGAGVTIDGCLVYGNVVRNGAGGGVGYVADFKGGTVRNTTIVGNTSTAQGGGLLLESKLVKVENCVIAGNRSDSGESEIAGTPAAGSDGNAIGGDAAKSVDYTLSRWIAD